MIWLTNTLAVGAQGDCTRKGIPIIHACKDPCHRWAVSYKRLPHNHPHYLTREFDHNLYLNMIDPPQPLFHLETFTVALDFIDAHNGHVLIHCNQGLSRAPSIALLWLLKRNLVLEPLVDIELPNTSFTNARAAFQTLYPDYAPSPGIATFLTEHWDEL
jgi:hypothetical protein